MRRMCVVLSICLSAGSAWADKDDDKGEDPPVAPPPPPADSGEPPPPEAPPAETETPPAETETPPAETETPPPAEEPTAGKTGKISGVVIDAKTGEAIIEAQVTVVQTGKKVLTDIDGNYEIKLPPGSYDIRVFAELKTARRISKITVEAGKTAKIDVQLGQDEEKITVQEVVVTARPDTATEAVQIVRRQKSAVVQDGVSAEQISRTPDSNAGEAVKRVVSATIQDNKYVVVRGLGGRYSNTLLNGAQLPSPDPDNPSAPLDLFPAALLANLTVNKTFSADIPGNFAGGSLQIETKEFPSRFILQLKASLGGDSSTTFRNTNTSFGSGLDILGFDSGKRSLPNGLPQDGPAVPRDGLSRDDVNRLGGLFNNNWKTYHYTPVPNVGLGATVGDTVSFDEKRLGYLATLNYGDRWTRRMTDSRTYQSDTMPLEEYKVDWGQRTTGLGGLLNLGYAPNPTHRLGMISLYTHSTDDNAQISSGKPDAFGRQFDVQRTRIRYVQRGMFFNQLSGEHVLGGPILSWQGNVALAMQDEPDLRDVAYLQGGDGLYRFISQAGSGERAYTNLRDLTLGGTANLTIPFSAFKLKLGGSANNTSRDFDGRRFRYSVASASSSTLTLPPEELFTPEHIGTDLKFEEITRGDDAYTFRRTVVGGFAMVDVPQLDPLRIVAGVRFEHASQRLQAGSNFSNPPSMDDPHSRSDNDFLPTVNLIYALAQGFNLRGSYSLTLARPQIRELAPYKFFDYVRNRAISGNPDLTTTKIHNADLRAEYFFGGTELVAASVFYKKFLDPIEAVIANGSQDIQYVNAAGANSVGGELELRISGGRLTSALETARLVANLTLIFTEVDLDPNDPDTINQTNTSRPLQGQSPYVANVELGYTIPTTHTDISLLYNVFGRRIAEVGAFMFPDVYEQPFHRLDLSISQRLPDSLRLKLAATNLLNQRVKLLQGQVEVLGYDPGVAVLVSLEWTYDENKEK